MQVENIRIKMLGGFAVWVNGKQIVDESAKLTKPWQLFCYLVLHREKFSSNRKLIATLWADDVLTDPANVLKNAVYSLRKELCGGESMTDTPIIYSTGGYRFDPNVELLLDVESFTDKCELARNATGTDNEVMALCQQAVDAYAGDFLPQLDNELWVVPLTLEYKRRYLDAVHQLSELMWRKRQHKELLALTSDAYEIEPLDERNTVYMFRAMDALHMYRVVVTSYSRLVQQFEDALGSQPPSEVQRIFSAASERIHKTEQDIIVIKTELSGIEQAQRPQRGAFFCSYSNMKHMYQLLRRSAERNNQVLVLALFTLQGAKNAHVGQHELARAMAEFKVVAMNNLRKADAISRYSKNQYSMLLTVNSLEDGRLVRDRIRDRFFQTMGSEKITLDVKLSEV